MNMRIPSSWLGRGATALLTAAAVVAVSTVSAAAAATPAPTRTTVTTKTVVGVKYGGATALTARLTVASSGAPLAGGRLYLQQWESTKWVSAGSVVTNANGTATAYATGLTTSRLWTLYWPGNSEFAASRTAYVTVNVAAQIKPAPLRLTFYYPWFPSGFVTPGSNYTPSDGQYSTADLAEDTKQVAEMRYAGLNGAIFSWEGQSDAFSKRLSTELTAAKGTPFKWSVYYELEGQGNPSVAAIKSDLSYLYTTYANSPNFLHINGKPVIFVWTDANDGCAMLARWAAANANHQWYVVQKEFFTQPYLSCPNQPDAWHEYAPASRVVTTPDSYSVSPGFFKKGASAPLLARSVSAFDTSVQAMKASDKQFELVTTWNEWIEGTAIESATQWASASGYGAYVDVLHKDLGSQ
jgi:hypothetical protein